MIRQFFSASLLALLALTPTKLLAQQSYPYSCEWISEVNPETVIRFTSTNGIGTYQGNLFYRGQPLMSFQEGQFQGYGSHWWSTGAEEATSNQVVVFAGEQVVRGTPGFLNGHRPRGPQRVLLVGLGSSLWYGREPAWREQQDLITAGEGFWRPSEDCRPLF